MLKGNKETTASVGNGGRHMEPILYLVKKIDGDYFNVVGLPTCRMFGLLKERFGTEPRNIIRK